MSFSILVHNDQIPEKKGIGGSAALCTSIASSLLVLFKDIGIFEDREELCANDEVFPLQFDHS